MSHKQGNPPPPPLPPQAPVGAVILEINELSGWHQVASLLSRLPSLLAVRSGGFSITRPTTTKLLGPCQQRLDKKEEKMLVSS